MSIYSAMNSGVSGLAAQSAKFSAISDNIANSGTVGYKRTNVQFATLVTNNSSAGTYSAGGVEASLRTEVSRGGIVTRSTVATDLAISGNGFFVVGTNIDSNNIQGTTHLLTRGGSFRPDANGNLMNTGGYYLQGWPLDNTGQVIGGGDPSRTSFEGLQTVSLGSLTGTAQATTEITFAANLPASKTVEAPGQPFSTSIDYYSPLGFTSKLELEWVPNPNPAPPPPAVATPSNMWTLNVKDGNTTIQTVQIEFNDGIGANVPAGRIKSMDTGTNGVIPLTLNSGQEIQLNLGENGAGLTQWGDQYAPGTINKDGAGYAPLDRVEIGSDGVLTAIYRNGLRQAAYKLPVANVTNPDGLIRADGNAFQVSRASGDFYLWDAGAGSAGTIDGGALEASNVDIAEELTSIIETQRAYSSNAKIIQTADEMMDEITRLMR
ncbi:flagellar hook protein FlgE [Niveispirillum fermenti]|uniref:flagellar hook protein FlgE n=1 Tax=Niveispirillum fermenti TaxID=1233113 RepID=UPI003A8AB1F6